MPTDPHITQRRSAGPEHQVVTVEGGSRSYRRSPCPTCPWRKDAVGEFPAEAFRHSAQTGADGATISGPDGLAEASHTFACHTSGTEKPATCAGYILRSQDAIGWRLAVIRGLFDPRQVSDRGIALFDSYYEMAVANGVPPDDPALRTCRPWRGE